MIRLFRVSIPTSVVLLVLSDALLITACYCLAAFIALDRSLDPWFYLYYENGLLKISFVVVTILTGFYFMDLYDDVRIRSRMLLMQQLCVLLGFSFLVQALIGYGEWSLLQLPQWTMVYGSFLVLLVVPAWRTLFFALVRKALPNESLLFLGSSPTVREIAECLESRPDLGFRCLGYVDNVEDFTTIAHLGTLDRLQEAVDRHKPGRIIVAQGEQRGWLPVNKLLDLRMAGNYIEPSSELYEIVFGRVSVRDLRPSQLIFSSELGPRPWTIRLQSLYSFGLGLIGLIVSLPVMAVVAVLVRLTSPGPALYRQKRIGLRGEPFYLYKFRSMYIDAEARTGPVWATKEDPRVTPLGRWLRKLRLDELPQFFNVIRGEMALVGPRPERPEFCAILNEKIPFYHQRHSVKPGITGWAQINHKYTETIEDTMTKLEYDLYYVKHLAPALDAYIIFHTLKVMLLFRGAQ